MVMANASSCGGPRRSGSWDANGDNKRIVVTRIKVNPLIATRDDVHREGCALGFTEAPW